MSVSASVYNLFDKSFADPGGPELRQDTLFSEPFAAETGGARMRTNCFLRPVWQPRRARGVTP